MIIYRLLLGLTALALVASTTALEPASAKTINFNGTLTNLFDPNNLSGIDIAKVTESLFSGSYTFEPTTPDALGGKGSNFSANYLLRPNVNGQGIAAQIGNFILQPPTGDNSYFARQFNNNDVRGWDYIEIDNGAGGAIAGSDRTRLFLSLEDQSGKALSSVGPNSDPMSFAGWERGTFRVIAPNFSAAGQLTSLSVAPSNPTQPVGVAEPSLWFGLGSVAAIGFLTRRQRRSTI